MTVFKSMVLFGVLMMGFVAPSMAEIYQCRDERGGALFSQQPCPRSTVTGSTEAHQVWREMLLLVNRGETIHRALGADLGSIKYCHIRAKEYAQSLAAVGNRLQSLSSDKHPALFKAQRALRECGTCRSSAGSYCRSANDYLDQAMTALLPPVVAKRQY